MNSIQLSFKPQRSFDVVNVPDFKIIDLTRWQKESKLRSLKKSLDYYKHIHTINPVCSVYPKSSIPSPTSPAGKRTKMFEFLTSSAKKRGCDTLEARYISYRMGIGSPSGESSDIQQSCSKISDELPGFQGNKSQIKSVTQTNSISNDNLGKGISQHSIPLKQSSNEKKQSIAKDHLWKISPDSDNKMTNTDPGRKNNDNLHSHLVENVVVETSNLDIPERESTKFVFLSAHSASTTEALSNMSSVISRTPERSQKTITTLEDRQKLSCIEIETDNDSSTTTFSGKESNNIVTFTGIEEVSNAYSNVIGKAVDVIAGLQRNTHKSAQSSKTNTNQHNGVLNLSKSHLIMNDIYFTEYQHALATTCGTE